LIQYKYGHRIPEEVTAFEVTVRKMEDETKQRKKNL
jgi:hypothetical protein